MTIMNCYKHPEVAAGAFCRTCGKPLCEQCQRPAGGTIVCEEHVAQAPQQPAPPPPPPPYMGHAGGSPGLAFVLGLIPGVGAIYNGQYAKGVVHVVIFGLLISIMHSGATQGFEPMFGMLIAIWYFYMPFEAYHTARKRQMGETVDEFSSIVPMRPGRRGLPVGPIVLIGLGVLFLLNTMEILEFRQIARYWPVVLIALGAYMLYCRVTGCGEVPAPEQEAHHEER
jgi:hypothetical protein